MLDFEQKTFTDNFGMAALERKTCGVYDGGTFDNGFAHHHLQFQGIFRVKGPKGVTGFIPHLVKILGWRQY